jgi:DNA-binding transcriptional LysR family regulator
VLLPAEVYASSSDPSFAGDLAKGFMLNVSLKQLEAFVWVSDLGSFRRAAERLNTTQPNISSRIAALESALGATLMERDAGSVRLTAKGHELLRHARQILRAVEDLIAASDRPALLDGTLKLGVTEMIVHTWLREFLNVLSACFPNIAVELTVDLSINLEKGLLDRSIDLALQSEPFTHRTSGGEDLETYPFVWVAAPTLELPDNRPAAIDDLASHSILTHARDTRPYQDIAAHFAKRRDLKARLVPSSSLSACLQMTVDRMGVAALPRAMVESELATGQLVEIDYPWLPSALRFMARFDSERAPQFVAQAAAMAKEVAAAFTTVTGRRHPAPMAP